MPRRWRVRPVLRPKSAPGHRRPGPRCGLRPVPLARDRRSPGASPSRAPRCDAHGVREPNGPRRPDAGRVHRDVQLRCPACRASRLHRQFGTARAHRHCRERPGRPLTGPLFGANSCGRGLLPSQRGDAEGTDGVPRLPPRPRCWAAAVVGARLCSCASRVHREPVSSSGRPPSVCTGVPMCRVAALERPSRGPVSCVGWGWA